MKHFHCHDFGVRAAHRAEKGNVMNNDLRNRVLVRLERINYVTKVNIDFSVGSL